MSRGSAVVSPDEKYAVIVPGHGKTFASSVVVLDAKTLGIQRKFINYILGRTKTHRNFRLRDEYF